MVSVARQRTRNSLVGLVVGESDDTKEGLRVGEPTRRAVLVRRRLRRTQNAMTATATNVTPPRAPPTITATGVAGSGGEAEAETASDVVSLPEVELEELLDNGDDWPKEDVGDCTGLVWVFAPVVLDDRVDGEEEVLGALPELVVGGFEESPGCEVGVLLVGVEVGVDGGVGTEDELTGLSSKVYIT